MATGVITVGSKKYAAGLYWEVTASNSNVAKAARTAAPQMGADNDWFCVRPGNTKGRAPQFGLGQSKLGHLWNMPSVAATLANRQPGSWAGVFQIAEGYWFVEVRDDLIAPEGDRVLADESEAMLCLQDVSGRGGLERIYAPTDWAIPGAESSSLASLLMGKAEVKLQPVKIPVKVFKIIGIVIVALLLCGFAVTWYYSSQAQKREEQQMMEAQQRIEMDRRQAEEQARQAEEQARREEEERLRKLQEEALKVPAFQRIWEQEPIPLQWLEACHSAMAEVQIAPLGWDLSALTCSGRQLVASWSRVPGPADIPPAAQIDASLQSATAVYTLPEMPARGAQGLWPAKAVNLYILRNEWKAEISAMADDPPQTGPSGQVLPMVPWTRRTIKWTVPLSPWTLRGPLVDIPGFVLQTLTWSRDGSWRLEGILYEQRQ